MNIFFLSWYKAVLISFVFILTACSEASDIATSAPQQKSTTQLSNIELTVYKSRTCGCCQNWIDHVDEHGFELKANNVTFMSKLKDDKGIAPNYLSCHTAVSKEGYVFEGHIPAKYIKQYLANVPADSIGLSVPAMPVGTPGMEVGERFMPYKILLLNTDGSSSVYAEVAAYEEQF